MAGRKLTLDPRRTTTRQGVIHTTSWAAVVAAVLVVAGIALTGVAEARDSFGLYFLAAIFVGGSLTFAILALGDR